MATYIPITDSEIAPESPVTVSLVTRLRDNALAYLGAPSGTKGVFPQAAAPLGWTGDVTHNDKAFRIVSGAGGGSGGTLAFSTVFARTVTDGHSLTDPEMPVHTHAVNDPTHIHGGSTGGGSANCLAGSGPLCVTAPQSMGNVATGISLNNAGGGAAHAHGMDIRVQYVDIKICTKD